LRLLGDGQGDLGRDLQVDHVADASIELEEGSGLLARERVADVDDLLGTELVNPGIGFEPSADVDEGILVAHSAPGVPILLDPAEFSSWMRRRWSI
jgi:hypothetical protein